jgi:hypothetical protein
MVFKKVIVLLILLLISLAGFYLIFASGSIDADPFSIILFLIVGGLIIYFYISRLRNND